MELQTILPLASGAPSITYDSKILLMGSCFSENIGAKLDHYKFQALTNPFGVIFNPISIERLISRALGEIPFESSEFFQHDALWKHFEMHSEMGKSSLEDAVQIANEQLRQLNRGLKDATHVILTLGTAWVYRNKTSQEVVANCHKVPQKEFTKELLSMASIQESLQTVVAEILKVNAQAKIIFTVSPVRHLKDGYTENNRSKGRLLDAIHQVIEHRSEVAYFPSYELFIDELRDYRFYADDLIHPNQLGIQYVWEKFHSAWISTETEKLMTRVDRVQKSLAHRPLNESSEGHQKFLADLARELEALKKLGFTF